MPSRSKLVLVLAGLSALVSVPAGAAAPGRWSLGVERVFGFSRISTSSEANGRTETTNESAVSLFSDVGGRAGYSTARVALDYLSASGVSAGGALGYQRLHGDGPDSVKGWLLAPRIGFFAAVTPGFGLWPRGGVTYVSLAAGADDRSATAITVELPLVFLVTGGLGIDVMPYADFGIAGGTDSVDQKLTELGLSFGLSFFF
jgi:hypothetical protein